MVLNTKQEILLFFKNYFLLEEPHLGFLYFDEQEKLYKFFCFKQGLLEHNIYMSTVLPLAEETLLDDIQDSIESTPNPQNNYTNQHHEIQMTPSEFFSLNAVLFRFMTNGSLGQLAIESENKDIKFSCIRKNKNSLAIPDDLLKVFPISIKDAFKNADVDYVSMDDAFAFVKEKIEEAMEPEVTEEQNTLMLLKEEIEKKKSNQLLYCEFEEEGMFFSFQWEEVLDYYFMSIIGDVQEGKANYEDTVDLLYGNGVYDLTVLPLKGIDKEALLKALESYYQYHKSISSPVEYLYFTNKNRSSIYVPVSFFRQGIIETLSTFARKKEELITENLGIKPYDLEDYYEDYKKEPRPKMVVKVLK